MRGSAKLRKWRLRVLGGMAVLAAGFTVGFGLEAAGGQEKRAVSSNAPTSPRVQTTYARVESLSELNELSGAVVIAAVERVTNGPTYYPDTANSQQPRVPIQTRDVQLRVVERIRGDVESNPTLVHFNAAPRGMEAEEEVIPRAGERYLLIMSRSDTVQGRWATPYLEGRVRIASGDELETAPVFEGGAAQELKTFGLGRAKESVK